MSLVMIPTFLFIVYRNFRLGVHPKQDWANLGYERANGKKDFGKLVFFSGGI